MATKSGGTIPSETVAKIREIAHEKADRFFMGISIEKSG